MTIAGAASCDCAMMERQGANHKQSAGPAATQAKAMILLTNAAPMRETFDIDPESGRRLRRPGDGKATQGRGRADRPRMGRGLACPDRRRGAP